MNVLLGIVRVARGRADGMAQFGASTHSFLSSLAPLIAFPVAGALLLLLNGYALEGLDLLGLTLVAQLAPPVLSHALAIRWQREALWRHYATAYNWCYWAVPVVAVVLMAVLGAAVRRGMAADAAVQTFFFGLAGYSLWLHWFVARHGLALTRWRAAILVLLVNGGALALAFGPRLLAG